MTDLPLHVQLALPNDARIDAFSSGNDEIDDYFRSRRWFHQQKNEHSPPTYQFENEPGGEVVGYAAAAFRNNPHPEDAATKKAKYLVVYAVGVDARFQGCSNPRSAPESFAVSIFRVLEQFARDKAGCAGLYLWVRSDNARAIAFYEKFGFLRDPGGPQQRDDKAPHLTMRKLFD